MILQKEYPPVKNNFQIIKKVFSYIRQNRQFEIVLADNIVL